MLVSIRARVGQKLVDFRNTRSQAEQVEEQATNESDAIRLRGRGDLLFFQSGQDEPVNRIANPSQIADRRLWRTRDGLKGPVRGFSGRHIFQPLVGRRLGAL